MDVVVYAHKNNNHEHHKVHGFLPGRNTKRAPVVYRGPERGDKWPYRTSNIFF